MKTYYLMIEPKISYYPKSKMCPKGQNVQIPSYSILLLKLVATSFLFNVLVLSETGIDLDIIPSFM